MKVDVQEGCIKLLIEKDIYNDRILHKCFYWYSKDFTIDIEKSGDSQYLVILHIRESGHDLQAIVDRIKRDLIDFKLRDIVDSETRIIRELLIAKAFSNYEEDDPPATEISDPIGFDPLDS